MSELRGYTCDGGCGATTVVERGDDLQRQRWFTLFGPRGFAPMHACSASCMVKALRQSSDRELDPAPSLPGGETP